MLIKNRIRRLILVPGASNLETMMVMAPAGRAVPVIHAKALSARHVPLRLRHRAPASA